NRVIHGRAEGLTDRDVTALIDSGTRLLRVIRSAHATLVTKQEVFRVRAVVQLFSDADATAPDPLWRGVMLEPAAVLLPPEEMVTIYPTTLPVAEGDLVTWKYDVGHRIGPRWYRDPGSGAIRRALDTSAAFVGCVVPPPF